MDREYWAYFAVVVAGLAIALFGLRAEANAQASQPQPLTIYRERPSCDRPVAYELNSSWANPMRSGLRVWVCE